MADINFHHPYTPYDIQNEFMRALYQCIEERKVGIFESPTGTGKSLSLICGSLTWLRDHKKKVFETGIDSIEISEDEPDWVREQIQNQKREEATRRHRELENRLAKIREKEKLVREKYESGEPQSKRRKVDSDETKESLDDEQFLLRDYDSDDETGKPKPASKVNADGLTAETLALMSKLGYSAGPKRQDVDLETVDEMKIFFCSRTHSQLSQFAKELNRVNMPAAISLSEATSHENELVEEFKHITLGSRKNLCINPKVKKLGNATAINERCMELQQPSTATSSKCPHVPTKETEAVVQNFRDHALAQVRDIEDLGNMGKKFGICPYYASRAAVKPAEIVTLPYPLLFQKSAREALDLSLKDHIVIIDEAHNLIDSITGIHSVSVSLTQLEKSRGQLMLYLQKFKNRLKGKNRTYVAQTVRLIDSLASCLKKFLSKPDKSEGTVEVQDMMSGKGVDQINIYKLDKYLHESKLARKVDGYIAYEEEKEHTSKPRNRNTDSSHVAKQTPVLMQVQSFLLALMNPSSEGQFFYSKESSDDVQLKYLLLDPTYHFKEIVEEARAVILAGGTMSPMSDFTSHLFSYLPPTRIKTLSCGHVIPPSSLLAQPIISGPSGQPFDFTFEKRNSPSTIRELGLTLLTLLPHIPDGVVVFFPSYTYLATCLSSWSTPSSNPKESTQTLFEALQSIKPIFTETRGTTSDKPATFSTTTTARPGNAKSTADSASTRTESLLASYTTTIHTTSPRGALLLAVLSGTLSEGINFADALGRCVIVVGLPYANLHTAEWKAKMSYITRARGAEAAREYYENACMRAVNQAVGRAVRHRGDYAAILMIDRRFGSERVSGKLSGWVRGSLRRGEGVEGVKREVVSFFEGKQ